MNFNFPGFLTLVTIHGCVFGVPLDRVKIAGKHGGKEVPSAIEDGPELSKYKGDTVLTSGDPVFRTFLTDSYLRYGLIQNPPSLPSLPSFLDTTRKLKGGAISGDTPLPTATSAADYFRNMNQEAKYLKNVRMKVSIETGSLDSEVPPRSGVAIVPRSARSSSSKQIRFAHVQPVQDSNLERSPRHTVYEMVLTVATALAALFTMGVLATLFTCCCRKQRQTEVDVNDNGEEKDNKKTSTSELHANGDGTTNHSETSRDDTLESPMSVKDKIKALEVQQKRPLLHPSPDLSGVGPTRGKKPDNEAFKAFENKGLLIGMGRAPQITVTEQEDAHSLDDIPDIEDTEDISHKIAATGPNDTTEQPSTLLTTDNTSIHSFTSQPYNPDVIVADVDDDEFGNIQRETEVLKSFRRAKPPRNRSPATRISNRKLRQKSPASLPQSEETEKDKRKSAIEILSENKENVSMTSSSSIQVSKVSKQTENKKDSLPKSGTPRHRSPAPRQPSPANKPPSPAPKRTGNASKSSSPAHKGFRLGDPTVASKRHSGYTENVSNIFYLIDPTVKNKCQSMGDVTANKLNKKPTSPVKTPEKTEDPDLVKALNQQIRANKKQEAADTQEEELESPIRERTQSDPSRKRKSKVIEQTAL